MSRVNKERERKRPKLSDSAAGAELRREGMKEFDANGILSFMNSGAAIGEKKSQLRQPGLRSSRAGPAAAHEWIDDKVASREYQKQEIDPVMEEKSVAHLDSKSVQIDHAANACHPEGKPDVEGNINKIIEDQSRDRFTNYGPRHVGENGRSLFIDQAASQMDSIHDMLEPSISSTEHPTHHLPPSTAHIDHKMQVVSDPNYRFLERVTRQRLLRTGQRCGLADTPLPEQITAMIETGLIEKMIMSSGMWTMHLNNVSYVAFINESFTAFTVRYLP